MLMKEDQAVELERKALSRSFVNFQDKHHQELTEMYASICQQCGKDCGTDPEKACGLLMGLTWHIFNIYFLASTGVN